MHFWDHSYPTPEENLAFDEAVLEWMDNQTNSDAELLRLWQMPKRCVVIGRSSKVSLEVNQFACQQDDVPIYRRMSGGASIVAGPGCLMFSLLLSLERRPNCRGLDGAHHTVMSRMREALCCAFKAIGSDAQVGIQGICDLTIDGRKISGNALRIKRNWLMYHGTLLINMPLEWIEHYLLEPPKQPEYRQGRKHREFVESLTKSIADPSRLIQEFSSALKTQWEAIHSWNQHPFAAAHETSTQDWVRRRYGDPAWHLQR